MNSAELIDKARQLCDLWFKGNKEYVIGEIEGNIALALMVHQQINAIQEVFGDRFVAEVVGTYVTRNNCFPIPAIERPTRF